LGRRVASESYGGFGGFYLVLWERCVEVEAWRVWCFFSEIGVWGVIGFDWPGGEVGSGGEKGVQ